MPLMSYCPNCDEWSWSGWAKCRKCKQPNESHVIPADEKMLRATAIEILVFMIWGCLLMISVLGFTLDFFHIIIPGIIVALLPLDILIISILIRLEFKHWRKVAKEYKRANPKEFKKDIAGGMKNMKPEYLED